MRQTNRETKRNQRNRKGKMVVLFNKTDKGCILDKNSVGIVYNSYNSSSNPLVCNVVKWSDDIAK